MSLWHRRTVNSDRKSMKCHYGTIGLFTVTGSPRKSRALSCWYGRSRQLLSQCHRRRPPGPQPAHGHPWGLASRPPGSRISQPQARPCISRACYCICSKATTTTLQQSNHIDSIQQSNHNQTACITNETQPHNSKVTTTTVEQRNYNHSSAKQKQAQYSKVPQPKCMYRNVTTIGELPRKGPQQKCMS